MIILCLLVPYTLFLILDTGVSLKYETNVEIDPCLSLVTHKNLCFQLTYLWVILGATLIAIGCMIVFRKRILTYPH